MGIEISHASVREHFRVAACLHAKSITEGFLSTLGTRFLTALYEGIGEARDSGVLVAIEKNQVVGFVSYTANVKQCYKDTIRNQWLRLGLAVGPNLLKPQIYLKIIETLRYPSLQQGGFKPNKGESTLDKRPELLSMAVSSEARGKGIGSLLVDALDQEMARLGVKRYMLVTHALDARSNNFYKSCGFERTKEFMNHGKPMNEYQKMMTEE
jgi:ribosomal protein S18 acetylase RimI-like enzyme